MHKNKFWCHIVRLKLAQETSTPLRCLRCLVYIIQASLYIKRRVHPFHQYVRIKGAYSPEYLEVLTTISSRQILQNVFTLFCTELGRFKDYAETFETLNSERNRKVPVLSMCCGKGELTGGSWVGFDTFWSAKGLKSSRPWAALLVMEATEGSLRTNNKKTKNKSI